MCISFQFQAFKLGRGGMILTDNESARNTLKKMSYDGRSPELPWRDQNVEIMGYHYYGDSETAQMGLDKFEDAKTKIPRKWVVDDWPDLTKMNVFK